MNKKPLIAAVVVVLALVVYFWAFAMPSVPDVAVPTDAESIERGEYLVAAGGCKSCHQIGDAQGMTGGYKIESPFGGAFYSPNITPDPETGIGGWTGRDFILAMKHGRTPNGSFYFPSFPYRSYQGMSDEEVLDIAAYVMAQPPIRQEQPRHDIPVWQPRIAMAGWMKMADWLEGEYPALPADEQIQRGAYLARHFGHCGECHTPRNGLGVMQLEREFQGSDLISTPIDPAGLSSWGHIDFVAFLELGMTASFDFVGGSMEKVITDNTSQLSPEDRDALAAFFIRDPAPVEAAAPQVAAEEAHEAH